MDSVKRMLMGVAIMLLGVTLAFWGAGTALLYGALLATIVGFAVVIKGYNS